MQLRDAADTAAMIITGFQRGIGSRHHTSHAATGVQTDWPYCASQRDSRLMSPLKFNVSVVGTPRHSRTNETTAAARRMISTIGFMWREGFTRAGVESRCDPFARGAEAA